MAHLWESCLPCPSIAIKHLCLVHRKHWADPPVSGCKGGGNKLSPPQADGSQQVFDFAPSPLSIKGAWILTQARWFFGTWVLHLLGLLAFPIKSLFLVSATHLSIYCHASSRTSLDLATLSPFITFTDPVFTHQPSFSSHHLHWGGAASNLPPSQKREGSRLAY